MRLAASGAPVAVKRRTVDPLHTVKIFPVLSTYLRQLYVGGKLKNIYTEMLLRKMTWARYGAPWFVEQMQFSRYLNPNEA
jgi:hypothetical protein